MLLEVADIRLVPLAQKHKNAFLELVNIPDINHRINKPFPCLERHFEDILKKPDTGVSHVWVIEKEGTVTGSINTGSLRHPKVFQGGYWIHPDFQGRNIATAALGAVRDFIFERHNAVRIQAVVQTDNAASMRVLEKCGYEREGLLRRFYPSVRGELFDVYMYACVRSETVV